MLFGVPHWAHGCIQEDEEEDEDELDEESEASGFARHSHVICHAHCAHIKAAGGSIATVFI